MSPNGKGQSAEFDDSVAEQRSWVSRGLKPARQRLMSPHSPEGSLVPLPPEGCSQQAVPMAELAMNNTCSACLLSSLHGPVREAGSTHFLSLSRWRAALPRREVPPGLGPCFSGTSGTAGHLQQEPSPVRSQRSFPSDYPEGQRASHLRRVS